MHGRRSRRSSKSVARTSRNHSGRRRPRGPPMGADNIFSGLKVVDLASFIAGPSAAVILGDFGAHVVKVEPPTGDPWRMGYKIPPQPRAHDKYPWHLINRTQRAMALEPK